MLVALLFWYTFGSGHAEAGAIDPATEAVRREGHESGERIEAAG